MRFTGIIVFTGYEKPVNTIFVSHPSREVYEELEQKNGVNMIKVSYTVYMYESLRE